MTTETPTDLTSRLAVFASKCINAAWDGDGIDGGDIQEMAIGLGLVVSTRYDPSLHGESLWDAEPGDPWYVFSDDVKALLK